MTNTPSTTDASCAGNAKNGWLCIQTWIDLDGTKDFDIFETRNSVGPDDSPFEPSSVAEGESRIKETLIDFLSVYSDPMTSAEWVAVVQEFVNDHFEHSYEGITVTDRDASNVDFWIWLAMVRIQLEMWPLQRELPPLL